MRRPQVMAESESATRTAARMLAIVRHTPMRAVPMRLNELGSFPMALLVGGALVFDTTSRGSPQASAASSASSASSSTRPARATVLDACSSFRQRRQARRRSGPASRAEQATGHQQREQVQRVVDRGGLQMPHHRDHDSGLLRIAQARQQRRLAAQPDTGQSLEPVGRDPRQVHPAQTDPSPGPSGTARPPRTGAPPGRAAAEARPRSRVRSPVRSSRSSGTAAVNAYTSPRRPESSAAGRGDHRRGSAAVNPVFTAASP